MVKKIFFFMLYLISINACAHSSITMLSYGEKIYSEYYPNPSAKLTANIVFINGSGTDISEWKQNKKFFNCVKKAGSVFLYDRPGLGNSPSNLQISSKQPITAKYVSIQMSLLLDQLKISPPYIFVAHSYGAIYAGYYTLMNPKNVKALILIDPVPRDFNFSAKKTAKYEKGIEEAKSASSKHIYQKYSGSEAEVIYQMLGFSDSKNSIKKLGMINNDIPVIIISSTGMELEKPIDKDWYMNQKQWLNKNSRSNIYRVTSGHFIQFDQPDFVCNIITNISEHS